jgi:cytochrome c-type biogenesis protein CcmH
MTSRLALVLAAACVGIVLGAAPAAAAPPNAADLESEIVCPVCKSTLDMSNAEVAQRMKALIRDRIAEGWTEQQIKAELVDQFGARVLAEPQKKGFDLLAWWLPIGGGILGALLLGGLAVSWTRRRDASPGGTGDGAALDPELEGRVDAALAQFEE